MTQPVLYTATLALGASLGGWLNAHPAVGLVIAAAALVVYLLIREEPA